MEFPELLLTGPGYSIRFACAARLTDCCETGGKRLVDSLLATLSRPEFCKRQYLTSRTGFKYNRIVKEVFLRSWHFVNERYQPEFSVRIILRFHHARLICLDARSGRWFSARTG